MRSSGQRWIGGFLLASALAGAGCRDLVEPRPPAEDPGAQPFVEFRLRGLDPNLDRATVVLSDSAYVDPGEAGRWEAEAYLNEVRVAGAPPGTYDVTVTPVYAQASTPEWTSRGVVLGESPVLVTYPAIAVRARLDWPELAVMGLDRADLEVHFHYELVDAEGGRYSRYQIARATTATDFEGSVPWEGTYQIHLRSDEPAAGLSFSFQDSLAVVEASPLTLVSPFSERTLVLTAGTDPLQARHVRVVHREYGLGPGWSGSYTIRYVIDRARQSDAMFTLPPWSSLVEISWVEGPAFLAWRVLLGPDDMEPGTVELGPARWTLQVTGPTGAPLPGASLTLEQETWPAGASGVLEIFVHPGSYAVTAAHPGHVTREAIVHVEGDAQTVIRLEAE